MWEEREKRYSLDEFLGLGEWGVVGPYLYFILASYSFLILETLKLTCSHPRLNGPIIPRLRSSFSFDFPQTEKHRRKHK